MACPRFSCWLGAAVIAGALAAPCAAQARAPRGPSFDDASVVPSRSSSVDARFDLSAADRFTATGASLADLIRFAYGVQDAGLIGGADWIRAERFDLTAIAGQPLPPRGPSGPSATLALMVRTLLADRFGLVLHQETRELPVFTLAVAQDDRKFGPEIGPSKLECEEQPCVIRLAPGQMVMGGASMAQLATALSTLVQRVVLDRTRLAGTFDVRLAWTPDSLTAALREQLGLTLDSSREPIEVLVIDRAERPMPD